jgi:hypothetical protein
VGWIDFMPPEHLYFFTPQTVRSVFERAGFIVERIWTASIGRLDGRPYPS